MTDREPPGQDGSPAHPFRMREDPPSSTDAVGTYGRGGPMIPTVDDGLRWP